MISAGPFTLAGPGPNPPGQVELDPPAGDVVGVQVINSGLYVLQAVTGGSGSFIPPGWCQTLLIQPGAAVIVTQSTAAGPETVTTVFANWLQPKDQPPPSGPYTQVPPTPALLGEIPAAEVTSTITLYPSSLAWGVLVLTSNPDFTATSENGSALSPVSLELPVHPWGNGMYYVPYVNAGAPTPQLVLSWAGRGDGFFYEADEPLAAPPGVTSLEGAQTSAGSLLSVPGGSPFLTLASTGGVAPSSVVGSTTGISYPITAVSSELWSTFIPGWDKNVTVTWPSSVTWYSSWSNTPFEQAGVAPAPVAARVYLAGSQTLPYATQTVVAYDTVDFDTNGAFDVATHKYICPKTGYYRVYGQGSNASGDFINYQVAHNGTTTANGPAASTVDTYTEGFVAGVQDTVYCTAGDDLEITGISSSNPSTVPLYASPVATFATFEQVH